MTMRSTWEAKRDVLSEEEIVWLYERGTISFLEAVFSGPENPLN